MGDNFFPYSTCKSHWRIQGALGMYPTGTSGGSKGGRQGRAPPPGGQNSFIFMQFLTKKIGSRTHFGSWRPPWGKFWIHHCRL